MKLFTSSHIYGKGWAKIVNAFNDWSVLKFLELGSLSGLKL